MNQIVETGAVAKAVDLKAVYSTNGTFRVHAADCSDLKKLSDRQTTTEIPVSGTREEIAAELMADFIDEGSMDADEAVDHVRFLPCSGL